MVDACSWAAGEAGVDVDLLVETYFRGYRIKSGSPAPGRCPGGAADAAGSSRPRSTTGGGSDANALRAAGFDALLLANGTEANHTSDESVSAQALVTMLDVCAAVVDEIGAG